MRDPESRDDLRPGVSAALLALVLGLAAAVRLYRLGTLSVWLDEAYTYSRAALPAAQTIAASIGKNHVPTYFLFMHYWLALFGDDETALRLPSAIFGVLTVAAAAQLGRIAAGARVGLATGLLVALSPLQVRYSQEARMYTMFTFTATVALCGVVFLVREPEQAALPLWRRSTYAPGEQNGRAGRLSAWAAYVLGAVGTLYLHNTGVFLIATCAFPGLLLLALAKGKRLHVLGNLVLANLAVLALWGFWIGHLLTQTDKVVHRFWPDFPTPRAMQLNLRMMYLYDYERYLWLELLLGALALLGLYALRKRPRVAAALVMLGVLPPAIILLVSLRTPMFMPRIMLWAPIPIFALMAAGIFALPLRVLPYAICGAILFGGGESLERYYFGYTSKPPWKEVAKLLSANNRPGTRFIAARSQDITALAYYFGRKSDPIAPVTLRVIPPQRLRHELRGMYNAWIVDQKQGKKSNAHRTELGRLGTLVYERRFAGVLVTGYSLHLDGASP